MRNSVLLTLAVVIAELYAASAQGGCEDGWSRSPDRCLKLFGDAIDGVERLTWSQADEACKDMGATLASIKTKETQPIMSALLSQAPSSNVWIGLNDINEEYAFKWPDGSPLDDSVFVNWALSQPDNGDGPWDEDCVYLGANEDFPGEWYDGFCFYPRAYICEKPQDPTLPTVSTSVACGVSDPAYILFERACYKLDRSVRNHDDAVTFCQDEGDGIDIVWVDDAFQEAFLQAILLNAGVANTWIGLKTQVNISRLVWEDGVVLTYTDWEDNQPESTQQCGILTPDGWQSKACSDKHAVICRKNLVRRQPPPNPISGTLCPSPTVQPEGSFCIIGLNGGGTVRPWDEAQDLCLGYDTSSRLASVHNLNEDNTMARSFLTGSTFPFTVEMWLGLRKTDRGHFEWEDGSPLDYVNFGGNSLDQDCVAMVVEAESSEIVNVEWQTFDCSATYGYLCRFPSLYEPPERGGCLPGWYQLDKSCLRSLGLQDTDRRDYLDSQEYCQLEGGGRGKLFQVTNQLEQSLLALLLQDYVGVTNLWIGLSDSEEEGRFVWSDGTPMGFTQWAPNQPNGFTEVPNEPFRDCVEVRTDPKYLGEWDDINCLERRGFICQTPLYEDLNSTDIVVPEMCEFQPGYSEFKDGCYKLVNETMSFDEAQTYCINEGAWLSTVRDGFYNALLSLLTNWNDPTPEYVWMGLRQDSFGVYGWERTNPNEERWPLNYAKWDKGYPKGNINICGALNRNSTWVDMDCSTENLFICEYTETRMPIDYSPYHCADGWEYIGGHCYKFTTLNADYPELHFTYLDAKRECSQRYNATLPGIHSSSANYEFTNKALENLGDRNVWLGLHQSAEGYYVYEDERILNYVNWDPNAADTSSDCISLDTVTGRWLHSSCFSWGGLVCETDPLPGYEIPCDDGWSYMDECYYVSDAADETSWLSWKEAELWCNEHKGHLTTMTQGGEREFIKDLIKLESESFWIGLNNIVSPGNWIWSDGTAYDHSADRDQWSNSDETNKNNMEYCALINDDALWEDHNCGIRRPFICKSEISQTEPIVPSVKPPEGECPEGAYRLEDRCYDLTSMGEPKTWIEAHKECQFRKGELAGIHSYGVQALLTFALKNVDNNVWLGLNRLGDFDQFFWSDGSDLDFENWALGEPNIPFQQGNEDMSHTCVEMTNNPTIAGRWNDVNCEMENGFICEMRLNPKNDEQPLPYQPCPDKPDYHSDGQSCFKIYDRSTSFSNAVNDCEEDGAYLASVGDAYEQAFIQMFMAYDGLDSAWIGMRYEEGNRYVWLDGWPVHYTNWANGYPVSFANNNRFVLLTHEGWKNVMDDGRAFVCKTTSVPKPTTQLPVSGSCWADWYMFQDHCYYFDVLNTEVSYAEGLVRCQNRGGEALLPSVADDQANFELQTTARSLLGVNSIWIGLVYQNEEFEWVDGSPVTYTNWASGHPEMPIGADICVQMVTSGAGQWRNEDCFVKAGYVCQAPLIIEVDSTTQEIDQPTRRPVQEGISTNAIIGISVSCGGILLLMFLSAICYFSEKSRMNKKRYAQHRTASYNVES